MELKHNFEIKEKLPKEFKDKWVKALRSGKYKQGEGYLHDNGKYCCLGVACGMMGYTKKDLGGAYVIVKDEENLSRDFKKIPKIIKHVDGQGEISDYLTNKNDNGTSFKDIANWIEKYL